MSKTLTLFTLFFCFLIGRDTMQAQSVWPGDVNNNGVVNSVDFLYWGVAYGKTGKARANTASTWQAHPMVQAWLGAFPETGGMNYGYGDCNGDGKVDLTDATTPIKDNFWKKHDPVTEDIWSALGGDFKLDLTTSNIANGQANPGRKVKIKVALSKQQRSEANARQELNFYGIAFVLKYNRALVTTDGINFTKLNNFWIDPTGNKSHLFFKNQQQDGTFEIAITRTDLVEVNSSGEFGTLEFTLKNDSDDDKTLELKVEKVRVIDATLKSYSVTSANFKINVVGEKGDDEDDEEPNGNGGGGTPVETPCPNVVNPVCGKDGKVYLNSCYAEKANVAYTEGVCYENCVNPALINLDAICPAVYDPVCGCNGVTYQNECTAAAAGVVFTKPGPCNKNNYVCYDPNYVITAAYTTLVPSTGVINFSTPQTNDPVCGCNNVTYKNSYVAEANGIRVYTKGKCAPACVDPTRINPDAVCTLEYNPVCGCNGVTYSNPCKAAAAGVVSTTPGVCGGNTTPWCNKATPLDCGNFLSSENTTNAGNQIGSYPCSSKNYSGPEKVYIINKTSAGNLQIGLEIMTPGLDLDLFLLSADCSFIKCLKSSTTNNTQTNNEGIALEDAPVGTYYLVVDGPAAGQYRLELSCGYLYCGDAVSLTCGQPYNGKNHDGDDNVSLYGCAPNILNVENNGPEKVHTFTITQAGAVSISLSGLSANLELFLLSSCDRSSCMAYSQNSGNNNESITATLQPGTYYVVVDGYNGATSNYRLLVDCAGASCNLGLTLTADNAVCGQNSGSINIQTTGGSPSYIISWTGPVSGNLNTQSIATTLQGLPPGTYTVTVTDYLGCKSKKTVTINSGGNLTAQTTITNANCGAAGKIKVIVGGGSPKYKIHLSGAESGTFESQTGSFELKDLVPGSYHIYIIDESGCSISKDFTIGQEGGNFYFTATPNAAACESPGSIAIKTFSGTAPYKVYISGPKSGSVAVNASSFNIVDLPGGTYTIKIEDASGCSHALTVTIGTTELTGSITPQGGSCTQPGSIKINIATGKPNFIISWAGPVSGNETTSNTAYTIGNLPPGSYTITIKDGNWCALMKVVVVTGNENGFDIDLTPENGACETKGGIKIKINGGTKPYKITWSGAAGGNATTENTSYQIPNLSGGTYTVKVVDKNGCDVTETTQILVANSSLSLELLVKNATCIQSGSILVDVNGGISNYIIKWEGPVNGSFTSNNDKYEIPNLPAGTYKITATDGNWCATSKTIIIESPPTELFIATSVNGACEAPGSIKLNFIRGMPAYTIQWTGPQSNLAVANGSSYTILNLPKGTYTIKVTDSKGCIQTQTVQVNSTENNLSFTAVLSETLCGQNGTIKLTINSGTANYKITWDGPVDGSFTTSTNAYDLTNLPAGSYIISIIDGNLCSTTKTVNIAQTPENSFTATPKNGICESPGSIKLNFTSGIAPYAITWTGTAPGSATTSGNLFTLQNLSIGTYLVKVTDKNGCASTKEVKVGQDQGGITVNASLIVNQCGQYNSIWVDFNGGTPQYTVVWEGPVNGMNTTNNNGFEIPNLPAGKYTVTVKDNNWCYVSTMVTIYDTPTSIVAATSIAGSCNQNGAIRLAFNGAPNYQVILAGAVQDTFTVAGSVDTIPNLPAGAYTVKVTNAAGCTETENVTVTNVGNLAATINTANGTCDTSGTINMDITAGVGPFSIFLTGTLSDTLTADSLGLLSLSNLLAGNYILTLESSTGCVLTDTIAITLAESVLEVTADLTGATCSSTSSLFLNISGGSPTYTVNWSGEGINGSGTTSDTRFTIPNLRGGTYAVTVKDANGCADSESVKVIAGESSLSVAATVTNGLCGQAGQVLLSATGGTGPFTYTWNGATSGTTTSPNATYTISNLNSGTYTVTVTENSGCSRVKMVSVTNSNQAPVANFSFTVSGSSVTFANLSSPGTYQWTFGDNGNANINNPNHSYGGTGSFNVCLKATNPCGTKEVCKTVTIGAPENAAVIDIQDGAGSPGATIYVPVVIENCVTGTIVSFAGSLSIANTSVGTIMGIVPGTISPQYSAANQTFSYFSNNGAGVPCDSGQILFYVAVQLNGSSGASTVLNIVSNPLPIELGGMVNGEPAAVQHYITSGQVSVASAAIVKGEITTYWGDGVPNVEVEIINGTAFRKMEKTDTAGRYKLPEIPLNKEYSIVPKLGGTPENGLSTYALFAGQRFILGMEPAEIVSPYQIIAGDANCDNKFSSLDLFIIQRLIIGTSTSFGSCPSWVFVRAGDQMPIDFNTTNVFPYHSRDTMMIKKDTVSNFVGVKVGDILGHANPARLHTVEQRDNNTLNLWAQNRPIRAGELVEITVTSDNFYSIASYQMGLSFDFNKLNFIELSSTNATFAKIALNDSDANNGVLRMSWFDLNGQGITTRPDEQLFTLRFVALENMDNLSNAIEVNSRYIRSEAYSSIAEPSNIRLNFKNTMTTDADDETTYGYKLYQNVPNPFNQQTVIGFDLPKEMQAEVIIYDQLGKVVKTYSGNYSRGYNQIELPRTSMSAGVYYYTLRTSDFAATKPMIVFE